APPKASLGTKAFEAAKFRLTLGIDLAAVERFAFVLFTKDLVGRVEFGKALGRLGIVLVGVGVQLLGELAKRTLDRRSIRILFHPQHLIGVAHREFLRFSTGIRHRLFGSNVGVKHRFRNAIAWILPLLQPLGLTFSRDQTEGATSANQAAMERGLTVATA